MAQAVKNLALSLLGSGLIPGLGTATCHRGSQKKKKKKNQILRRSSGPGSGRRGRGWARFESLAGKRQPTEREEKKKKKKKIVIVRRLSDPGSGPCGF